MSQSLARKIRRQMQRDAVKARRAASKASDQVNELRDEVVRAGVSRTNSKNQPRAPLESYTTSKRGGDPVQTMADVQFVIINRLLNKERRECENVLIVVPGSFRDMEVSDEGVDFGEPVTHWRIGRRGSQDIYASTFIVPREALERSDPNVADFLAPDQSEVEVTTETYVGATSLPDLSDVLYRGPTIVTRVDKAGMAWVADAKRRRHGIEPSN